jgi:hypothetical protein
MWAKNDNKRAISVGIKERHNEFIKKTEFHHEDCEWCEIINALEILIETPINFSVNWYHEI